MVNPYDQCTTLNPQIYNDTPGGITTFCGGGQISVRASGCPDANKIQWWVGNGAGIQGSIFVTKITTTTEARFQCISPATGAVFGPQKFMTFTVTPYSACNYRASIVNNSPGMKTVFCSKGWVDLAATGCPNNNLVRWYTDGTELNGGISASLRGIITRTSTFGVNCINPYNRLPFNDVTN